MAYRKLSAAVALLLVSNEGSNAAIVQTALHSLTQTTKFAGIGQQLDAQEAEHQLTNAGTVESMTNMATEKASEAKKDDQKYNSKDAQRDSLDDISSALSVDKEALAQRNQQAAQSLEQLHQEEQKQAEAKAAEAKQHQETTQQPGSSQSQEVAVPKPTQDLPQKADTQTPAVASPKQEQKGPLTQSQLVDNAMQADVDLSKYTNPDGGEAAPKQQEAQVLAAPTPAPTTPSPTQSKEVDAAANTMISSQAVEKSTTQFFEPGKSLSITDIVNVGGSLQKMADQKAAEDKAETTKVEAAQKAKWASENRPTLAGTGFRVDLSNEDGAGYVGTIYVGSNDAPVKVLFDTGSDFLALTSDLCNDPKLGKQEQDEPVFDSTTLSFIPSGKDHRKCKSTAYSTADSTSAKSLNETEHLDYGSAKLQGKLYQDRTCIDLNKTACTNLEFLALYQAVGLDDTDGVLGLAVHPDSKKKSLSYVWQLKNNGMIDNALVSFSIAGPNMDDPSYAIFGGINADQIVGGVDGLKKMQTKAYRPDWTNSAKQWALDGQTMLYGTEECQQVGGEKTYAAIIDTGSSNIGVPDTMFKELVKKWRGDVSDVDCVTDDNFCQVMTPCAQIAPKLKPIGFQISGQVFELEPSLYLHQAEGQRCQFAISNNQMKGSSGNLLLVGDTLLRHLYQVYDFENETISLGINKHSVGQILMYPAGERPEDAPKIQMYSDLNVAERGRFLDQIN